jgi:hypothetical protein
VSVKLLVGALLVLALGGFAGAYGFLSDPSGEGMGMAGLLERLPVRDYTLPGIFLLIAMFLLPLAIVYGLLRRPEWTALDPLVAWSGAHWAWAASLALGAGLAGWLGVQALLIGFAAPIQWFTAGIDGAILAATLAPATRAFYRAA